MSILKVENIKKTYTARLGFQKYEALKGISFEVKQGEFISIMGESGSGKSTLLNIIAMLLKPSSGNIFLNEKNTLDIKSDEISAFRRDHLGFVFQDFNLLDQFSVKDNMALPLVLARKNYKEILEKVENIAKILKIENILEKFPYEISGGEKQRCGIGRAIITKPELLLADEPTGALDSKSSDIILDIFQEINKNNQTILMVTHSTYAASKSSRVLFIRDGAVYHELQKNTSSDEEFHKAIINTISIATDIK